jgi:hypothetical protein
MAMLTQIPDSLNINIPSGWKDDYSSLSEFPDE